MRLYLIGRDGKIVYTGERGPFGFNPETWEEAIRSEFGIDTRQSRISRSPPEPAE